MAKSPKIHTPQYGKGSKRHQSKKEMAGYHSPDKDKLYGRRWKEARKHYLIAHPLCVSCEAKNILTEATVVDHIVPHKGNKRLFWDQSNWQPLCKSCHDKKTFSQDIDRPNKKNNYNQIGDDIIV
jgi:5-methylcytosine-specific restriction endonuclease McrA